MDDSAPPRAAHRDAGADLPFCGAQLGVYLEALAFPETAKVAGVFARYYEIDGPVDPAVMRTAVSRLAEENDALRLIVVRANGLARQRCLSNLTPPFTVMECKDDAAAQTWIAARVETGFSLDGGPLAAFALMRFPDGRDRLFVLLHHLIVDAWGANLAARRLLKIYGALRAGQCKDQQPPRYVDHLLADAAYRRSDAYKRDADFWDAFMSAAPAAAFAPLPGKKVFTAAPCRRDDMRVAADVIEAACRRAKAVGATPFQGILSCIHQAVARATGIEDLTFGVFRLNRDSQRLRETVGMFTTELAMRIAARKQSSLEIVAAEIRANQAHVYPHRRFATAELAFLPGVDAARPSVCDIAVSALPPAPAHAPGGHRPLDIRKWPQALHSAKPLHIFVHQGADGAPTLFQFFFSANHFTADAAADIAGHFRDYTDRLAG